MPNCFPCFRHRLTFYACPAHLIRSCVVDGEGTRQFKLFLVLVMCDIFTAFNP